MVAFRRRRGSIPPAHPTQPEPDRTAGRRAWAGPDPRCRHRACGSPHRRRSAYSSPTPAAPFNDPPTPSSRFRRVVRTPRRPSRHTGAVNHVSYPARLGSSSAAGYPSRRRRCRPGRSLRPARDRGAGLSLRRCRRRPADRCKCRVRLPDYVHGIYHGPVPGFAPDNVTGCGWRARGNPPTACDSTPPSCCWTPTPRRSRWNSLGPSRFRARRGIAGVSCRRPRRPGRRPRSRPHSATAPAAYRWGWCWGPSVPGPGVPFSRTVV